MGDFTNYERQAPRRGHTIAHEVTELRNADGTHPIVHIEHLGIANESYQQWIIASAKAAAAAPGPSETLAEMLGDDRQIVIAHVARRIENVFFSDGSQATDADLANFIKAMPPRAFMRLRDVAIDDRNFCEYPIAEKPADLAGK